MQEEKLRLLLKQTAVSSYVAIGGATISLAVLGWYHYTPWLVAWATAVALVSFLRARFHHNFTAHYPGRRSLASWDRRHKWSGMLSGGLWGLMALFPIENLPLALKPYPLLGPAIVATAALSSYSIRADHYRVFLASLITVLLASYTVINGTEALPAFLIFGIFGVLLDTTAKRYDQTLNKTLETRHEAEIARGELEQANRHLAEQHQLIMQEEEIARHVFEQLTLDSDKNIPGIRTWNQAMGSLSGDLIQVARSPQGDIYIFLGDFTGHGLPAALGAVPASTVFRTMVNKGLDVPVIAEELNTKLHELLPTGYFCCASIMKLSADRHHLTLWNGGLPPVLIWHQADRKTLEIPSNNLPMGVVGKSDFCDSCSQWTLADGDRVITYSDGLTEAEDVDGEMWGKNRLSDFLDRFDPSRPALDQLKEEILEFTNLAPASDDISVIEIEAGEVTSQQEVA